jgi:hypothetical protein
MVITFQGKRLLFVIAHCLDKTDLRDPVLHTFDVYCTTPGLVIYGLPAVDGWREYLLQVPEDGPWNKEAEAEAGKGFYMRVEWRLDYM